jgi:hypothetical protein
MGTVMFDEFDALVLLLPQLEMTVYRRRDEKISPEGRNDKLVPMQRVQRSSRTLS